MVESSAQQEEILEKCKTITVDGNRYSYVKTLGKGGCGMVCEYINQVSS